MRFDQALDVATRAAQAAGELLRADFHRSGGARGAVDKAEADVEAEHLIRGRLREAFPDWAYLGEETGRAAGATGAPIWLVDPNDGTRDYLLGRRGSAVSIGLLHERRPVLGVVFAFGYPDDRGDFFAWAEGCGPLCRNGRPVETTLPVTLAAGDVVLVSSKADRDSEGNLRCVAPARYRAVPSIAHRLALVAAGEAAATTSLYAPGAWDYGAGHALLRAAGGVLVDETGSEVAYAEDGSSQCRCAFAGSPQAATLLAARDWAGTGERHRPAGEVPVQPRRGAVVADAGLLSRAQGCLLGQVAGDSLGSLVEFATAQEIERMYAGGPRRLEDGGHWQTLAGQPTDDSELALALARSIASHDAYDPVGALVAYREWLATGPFDIGRTTRTALSGQPPDVESQANGSLMRVSPLGVFAHALPVAQAVELARRDSALTHPHPVCGDAVAAFVVAVSRGISVGDGPKAAYDAALDWARGAAAESVTKSLLAAASHPPVCDGRHQGFVLIALQNAFYELLHAGSLEDSVAGTVRRGGDTDTNAAIAGALLGAVHGREAVPPQWRAMVLSCRPLASTRPRPMAYWPIDVMELAERLLVAGVLPAAVGLPPT